MTNYKIMAMSAIGLSLITLLSACGHDEQQVQYAPQPQVIQQPATPVVIQQAAPASHDSGLGTALAAGAIGYMAGSSGNRDSSYQAPAPRVVHQTTVIKQKVYMQPKPKPAYNYGNAYKRSTTTTVSLKKGRR